MKTASDVHAVIRALELPVASQRLPEQAQRALVLAQGMRLALDILGLPGPSERVANPWTSLRCNGA